MQGLASIMHYLAVSSRQRAGFLFLDVPENTENWDVTAVWGRPLQTQDANFSSTPYSRFTDTVVKNGRSHSERSEESRG
jgi:hypothetical protein